MKKVKKNNEKKFGNKKSPPGIITAVDFICDEGSSIEKTDLYAIAMACFIVY